MGLHFHIHSNYKAIEAMKKALFFLLVLMYSSCTIGQNIRGNRVSADTIKYSLIASKPTFPANGLKTFYWQNNLWAKDSIAEWRFITTRDSSLFGGNVDTTRLAFLDKPNIFNQQQSIITTISVDTPAIIMQQNYLTSYNKIGDIRGIQTGLYGKNANGFSGITQEIVLDTINSPGIGWGIYNYMFVKTANYLFGRVDQLENDSIYEMHGSYSTIDTRKAYMVAVNQSTLNVTDTVSIVYSNRDSVNLNKVGLFYGNKQGYTVTDTVGSFFSNYSSATIAGAGYFGGSYAEAIIKNAEQTTGNEIYMEVDTVTNIYGYSTHLGTKRVLGDITGAYYDIQSSDTASEAVGIFVNESVNKANMVFNFIGSITIQDTASQVIGFYSSADINSAGTVKEERSNYNVDTVYTFIGKDNYYILGKTNLVTNEIYNTNIYDTVDVFIGHQDLTTIHSARQVYLNQNYFTADTVNYFKKTYGEFTFEKAAEVVGEEYQYTVNGRSNAFIGHSISYTSNDSTAYTEGIDVSLNINKGRTARGAYLFVGPNNPLELGMSLETQLQGAFKTGYGIKNFVQSSSGDSIFGNGTYINPQWTHKAIAYYGEAKYVYHTDSIYGLYLKGFGTNAPVSYSIYSDGGNAYFRDTVDVGSLKIAGVPFNPSGGGADTARLMFKDKPNKLQINTDSVEQSAWAGGTIAYAIDNNLKVDSTFFVVGINNTDSIRRSFAVFGISNRVIVTDSTVGIAGIYNEIETHKSAQVMGMNTIIQNTTTSTVYGSYVALSNSMVTGDNYGYYLATPTSVLNNNYGLYLDNQKVGSGNKYAIYSNGGDSYFKDLMSVENLKIRGGTPAVGKVWTATDTDGNGHWATPSSGAVTKDTTVTLSSSDILALYTYPKILVNMPGTGKAVEVISCTMKWSGGASPYSCTDTHIHIGTSAVDTESQCVFYGPWVNTPGVLYYRGIQPGMFGMTAPNTGLTAYTSANPTGGTGSAKIYLLYRIITL